MTVTLVLPDQIAANLLEATATEIETGGVLLARHVKTPEGDVRLLARELHWVPDDAYRLRNATAMSIASPRLCFLPSLLPRPITPSRSGCIHIPDASHRPGRVNMTSLSTQSSQTSSGSVLEAGSMEQSSSPGPQSASVSPATSSPRTGAPILIVCG